jgi:ATP-dependent DNA helicase RecG
MSIPTNAEILALLDRLQYQAADDLESQWLDFKPWTDPKDDMRVAVEYAVCFANADGGVVVFGVADKTKGRAAAIHGAKNYNLDTWRRGICDASRPNLYVVVEELGVPEGTGKLLLVRVPKGTNPPYGTAQGLFKKRVGKNCMPLDGQNFLHARVSSGAVDWSGQPAEGVQVEELDPVEIVRARNLLRGLNQESPLLKVREKEFLTGLGAVRGGKVTHTGLLLFGRERMLTERSPQHQVHYVYQTVPTAVSRNDSFRCGLLNVLEQIEQAFSGPANPEHELSVGLLKLRIPAFSLDTVREAVLNALTHRDYLDPGEVLIRHTPRELVVTSPGGFLANITPKNILRAEPISRNRTLAEAFEKLRLVERAGTGRQRIFVPLLSYGKRMPEYESDGTRVTLHIFDGSYDERMAKLVAQWRAKGREIDLDGLLILTYLRDHAFINTFSASELLQLPRSDVRRILDQFAHPSTGILERRGRTAATTFHLTKAVAKDLLGKAAYTKTKGIAPIRYSEMVRVFMEDHGSITPRECRELLGLGESKSAQVEVSRLLKQWSGVEGFLRREGKPPKVRYFPAS